jgi:hypothetical protein
MRISLSTTTTLMTATIASISVFCTSMPTPAEAFQIDCGHIPAEGRWRNTVNNTTVPAFVDIIREKVFESCDVVKMRVWMKQSDGTYSDWPLISLKNHNVDFTQWLIGEVGLNLKSIRLRSEGQTSDGKVKNIKMILLDSKNKQSEYSLAYGEKKIVPVVGRVRLNPNNRTICDDARENPASRAHQELCQDHICYRAEAARRRGSPAAPGLEAKCRAGEQ